MAIGTRRHKLLTGDDVGSLVRWTVADETARLALLLTADDNGALAKQTDDNSYHILADYSGPTWVQLGNVTTVTSSTDAPTVNDDELDGHSVGDLWAKTSATQALYVCFDPTAGAALWSVVSGGGGGGSWGSITGTLSSQTDLQAALDLKLNASAASAFGLTLIDDSDAAAARTTLGVDPAGTDNSTDQTDSTVPHDSVIGTPTTNTVAELLDATGGVSKLNGGGAISDDADGTVTVSAGQGRIRATDSDVAALLSFDWSSTPITPADNDLSFIYVEYNAGTPQVIGTTTKRTDLNTNIYLGSVYRAGTFLHITEHAYPMGNIGQRLVKRFNDTHGLTRASGSIVSDQGDLTVGVTTGTWWHGLDEVSIAAFDTGVADTFFRFYQDGAGGWTLDATETLINVLNYDDGTGVLATLTNNRFGVHWVYVGVDDDLYIIFGTGDYTSAQWSASTPPTSLPPHMQEQHAGLIGRIVVQKSAAVLTDVSTAFDTTFAVGTVTSHGDLADLGDDDHTQYSLADGTRGGNVVGPSSAGADRIATFDTTSGKLIQDTAVAIQQTTGVITNVGTTAMLVLAEQTGSMPSHSAGYGKIWVDNTAPTSLMFTDDVSSDRPVVMAPTGGVGDNRIVTWDGTTGSYVQSAAIAIGDNGSITMTGSDNKLEMVERGSAPSNSGTYGKFWVKNDAPTTPWFTDDVSGDYQLGDVVGPASAINRSVPLFDGTTGKLIKDSVGMSYGGLQTNTLALTGGTGPALAIYETGTAPTNHAAYGKFWVKNDDPTSPMFTDDVSNDYQLAAISLVGSGAPGVSTGDGYPEGHTYVDTTSNLDYSLVDATPGANIWRTGSFFTMNFGGRYPLGVNGTWYGAHGSYGWIDTDSDTTTTFGTGATPTLVQSAIQATVPCDCIVRSVFYKYLVAATTLTGYGGIHRIQTVHATGGNATVTAVGSLADLGAPTAVQVWHSDDTGIDLALDAGDGLGCYLSPDTNTTAVVLSASVLLERI